MSLDKPETFAALEAAIDAHGLSNVLEIIANICRDKADHVSINWQDQRLSKSWEYAATRIELAATVIQKKDGL